MSRIFYTFIGMLSGTAIPLGWLLWRAFSTRRAWWANWLKMEFEKHGDGYIALLIGAIVVFGIIGYLLGRKSDELIEESRSVKDFNYTLSQLAITDGLTGLFNARHLHELIDLELEGSSSRSPLTCLLIDIDHFKKINDSYGHPFGDTVLVEVSRILKRVVRRIDVVGRLGGEEFVIVLPNTPSDKAMVIAERIREAVSEEHFESEEKKVKVTVSLGVVTYPSAIINNKLAMMKAVDSALYSAKKSGRNRVVVWKSEDEKNYAA